MHSKTVIFLLIAATVLLVIKVYISNEIYYTSREIQKLSQQINALKEERNILKLKIEKLKYKNTIVDPLFTYMPPKIDKNSEENETSVQQRDNKKPQVHPKPKRQDAKELFETINIEDSF